MSIIERDSLGPGFERRLKAALDAVAPRTPHAYGARYYSGRWARARRPWRLATALVGAGAIVLIAISAAAATGSPDPTVWTKRAALTIQSVSHIPETSPNPPPNPAPDPRGAAPVAQPPVSSHTLPTSGREAEPTDTPKLSDKPEPSPRPDESPPLDHSAYPGPSPQPPDSNGHDSNSSPPQKDHGGNPHGH
jgi:hypothetical protein